jgi:2-oxoglutarate ferredoxin oxidoreductase subunit delta
MSIKILEDYCKGCGYCIEICPVEIFKESKRLNVLGYPLPEINNSDSCTQCKRCELICPEMAIFIEQEEKKDGSTESR